MAIFTDDFEAEDNNFNTNWTGKSESGVGSSIVVEQVNPHHNVDDALATISTSSAEAFCYKTIAANAIVYLRYYIKFTSINIVNNGHRVELGGLNSGAWQYAVVAALLKPAGVIIWGLWTQEGGVGAGYNGTHTPVVDTWYCLEVLRDVTNDLEKLYVNGVAEVEATRVITTNTAQAYVGLGFNSQTNVNVAANDCVVVDTSYIGPEAGVTVSKKRMLMGVGLAMKTPKFQPRKVCPFKCPLPLFK